MPFDKLCWYIATNQYRIHSRAKIPDIVMMINGIPVVVGEAKTPIRPYQLAR